MKITVFTSNQPRHLRLIERLAGIADQVMVVHNVNTLFPGRVPGFYRKSEVMQDYFTRVIAAEAAVFGRPRFLPANVRVLSLYSADVNLLERDVLEPALSADVFVVFGSAYIKPPLVDWLIERGCLNIHMGLSPWYRGSSCNFWALYDGHPEMVGATIHRLSRGLDSGAMLCHAVPAPQPVDGFLLGMLAVRAAHDKLTDLIASGRWRDITPVPQDRALQIRYTRSADFNDEVAADYLRRLSTPEWIEAALAAADRSQLLV